MVGLIIDAHALRGWGRYEKRWRKKIRMIVVDRVGEVGVLYHVGDGRNAALRWESVDGIPSAKIET